MNARLDLSFVSKKLAELASPKPARRAVLQAMFEQRYGADGPQASSLASVGEGLGVSRQAVLKSLERMLAFRAQISPDEVPALAAWRESSEQEKPAGPKLGGLLEEDVQRLVDDLWGLRKKAPRPKAPSGRIHLTPQQFDTLVSLGVVRESSVNCEASRLVLVEGLSLADVTQQMHVPATPLRVAALRVAEAYKRVRAVYRRAKLRFHSEEEFWEDGRPGRKPKASLVKMDPSQIEVLLRLGVGTVGNPAVEAAAEVLTSGGRMVDAAERHAVNIQRVNEARRRLVTAHEKLLQAFSDVQPKS